MLTGSPPAELDVAVSDEVLGLTLSAEAELLELVEDVRGEVVVEHGGLDVGRRQARGLPQLTSHHGHLAQSAEVVVVVRGHHFLSGPAPCAAASMTTGVPGRSRARSREVTTSAWPPSVS